MKYAITPVLILVFAIIVNTGTANAQTSSSTQQEAKQSDTKGTITVNMTGFKNDKGEVQVALYNNKKGFPDEPEFAMKILKVKITGDKATATFQSLNPGTYAVGCFHDEDSNGKMNTNWLGMPKEGYGASNDARGTFGPPSFKDASFTIGTETKVISMKLEY